MLERVEVTSCVGTLVCFILQVACPFSSVLRSCWKRLCSLEFSFSQHVFSALLFFGVAFFYCANLSICHIVVLVFLGAHVCGCACCHVSAYSRVCAFAFMPERGQRRLNRHVEKSRESRETKRQREETTRYPAPTHARNIATGIREVIHFVIPSHAGTRQLIQESFRPLCWCW